MAPIYQEDLAYIHHVGFGDLALGAAPGLLDALRESGLSGGLVVDLGCGGGLWLRELLRAGYAALGVDASPHLIKLAEGTAPGARLRLGSVYEFDPPPCAAVTALGEVLNYMPPEGPRPPSRSCSAGCTAPWSRAGCSCSTSSYGRRGTGWPTGLGAPERTGPF